MKIMKIGGNFGPMPFTPAIWRQTAWRSRRRPDLCHDGYLSMDLILPGGRLHFINLVNLSWWPVLGLLAHNIDRISMYYMVIQMLVCR